MAGYKQALEFIRENEDLSFVWVDPVTPSIAVKLLAQMYGKDLNKVLVDLKKNLKDPRKRMVRNLMTGKMVEIDYDTPRSCDPSSELYWSM